MTDKERILKLIADSLEQGKDFAIEQMPDVVQQLIMWRITLHSIGFALFLLILIISCSVLHCGVKKSGGILDANTRDYSSTEVKNITSLLVTLIAIPFVLMQAYNLLYIVMAPKVYVIQYISNL